MENKFALANLNEIIVLKENLAVYALVGYFGVRGAAQSIDPHLHMQTITSPAHHTHHVLVSEPNLMQGPSHEGLYIINTNIYPCISIFYRVKSMCRDQD